MAAQFFDKAAHIVFRVAAVHAAQDRFGNVLERQVYIGTDFVFLYDEIHQFIRKVMGIEVEQANPADALDGNQLAQEIRQQGVAGNIDAVTRRILSDEIDFLYAVGSQLLHFSHNRFDGTTVQFSPNVRNDAERAAVIAAFADFYIGTVRRRRPHAARMLVV